MQWELRSGRYWEREPESRRFSNVGRSEEGKTTVLQCLLYVCVFMHISWNYDIEVCLNLPLPYRPAARSFKPTWANMKNHINMHAQTHTHIVWHPGLMLMNVCPSETTRATAEWYSLNEDRRSKRAWWQDREGKKKNGVKSVVCCGRRCKRRQGKAVQRAKVQHSLSSITPPK